MVTAEPTTGYRLTLPTGWERITPGVNAAKDIDAHLARQLVHYSGRDRVLRERDLRPVIERMVSKAESTGAIDLYIYSRELRGIVVGMSFSVSVLYLGAGVDDLEDSGLVELTTSSADEWEFVDFDGIRMLRTVEEKRTSARAVRDAATTQLDVSNDIDLEVTDGPAKEASEFVRAAIEADAPITNRRISYYAAIPEAPGSFLMLMATFPGTELLDAQTLHFDAVASTLHWR